MIRNLMFLFVFLVPFALSAQEESKVIEKFVKEIDKKLPQLLHDFSIPGVAIAIIENGEIVLQKGYGFADIEKGVKVDSKTGFNIGSMSKTVTAWGVMKLVNEGKIDLDAPAEKYLTRWHLPESEFNSDKVTVRRLLSHTAGLSLPSVSAELSFDNLPTIVEWLNGKNDGLGRVEIILEPGTKWVYSGGGYGLLQLIIEEVTDQKFEDYMQVEVLDPLGMQNSSFKIDDKVLSTSATPYDRFGEPTEFGLFTVQAAAGLHTTLEDFIRFAFASLPGHENHQKYNSVLPVKTVQQMMEPTPNSAIGNWKYGLGYQTVDKDTSQVFIGHSGSNNGWEASFRLDPATNDGFIVLTNGSAGGYICSPMFCELFNWRSSEPGVNDCWSKLPIASKLYYVIEDKGLEDIAATYETFKKEQADEYDFSESQLNELGYHYKGKKELDKAIAIFKLNTEAFPYAYNAYDSYGEVLLEHGAREEAIENYRHSILLNPGNENGKSVLKKLGISTNDIALKIPIERLKLLEGEYILPDVDKKITYGIENGELVRTYKDRDFTIRLIPIGNNEFLYHNRGLHVAFDIRDTNAIVLIGPDEGKFKKVKSVPNQQLNLKTGLKIEYGPNLGTTHIDTLGIKHFYVHSTAIITNDSTIPIHLYLALSKEYEYPTFCGDSNKYKVFLLPEDLTPDTATLYNNIVNGQHDFLNTPLSKPNILNKTLASGEYCVVTFGVLVRKPTNCAAVPRAVFMYDKKEIYQACDRQINQAILTDPQLEIGLKLEYYNQRKFIPPEDGCTVIPCGKISYPER